MISESAVINGMKFAQCRVCGDEADFDWEKDDRETALAQPERWRCARHTKRNPCAIEGCKRSTAAPEDGRMADDSWLCGEHWRKFVPPRSRARRAYRRHFARAKKLGWNPKRVFAFRRFWDALIRMARRRASDGHLDEAEINKLMGWE